MRYRRDPVKKARLFDLLFDRLTTYDDLRGGTASGGVFSGLNPLFSPKAENLFHMEGQLVFKWNRFCQILAHLDDHLG